MSDVLNDDDLNVLAAEYALGTLDYEERKGANALLEVDPDFQEVVRRWERRFGELHLMVEAAQPDPWIWDERIRPKLGILEQMPPAIPSDPLAPLDEHGNPIPEPPKSEPAKASSAETEAKVGDAVAGTVDAEAQAAAAEPVPPAERLDSATPTPAAADPASPAAEPAPRAFVPPPPVQRRSPPPAGAEPRRSAAGWVATSVLMGVLAILLLGLIGAWRFFPERLPESLRAHILLNMPGPSATAQTSSKQAEAPATPAPPRRPKPPAAFEE